MALLAMSAEIVDGQSALRVRPPADNTFPHPNKHDAHVPESVWLIAQLRVAYVVQIGVTQASPRCQSTLRASEATMKPIRCAACVLGSFLFASTVAHAQDAAIANTFRLEPGPYSVGFRLFVDQDPLRVVTGGVASTTHPRPIRTYVWYPTRSTSESLRFARYAALADDDVWPTDVAGSLRSTLKYSRRPLARSLDPARFEVLLRQPVAAIENAKPADGRFPLVVIGAGLYYESAINYAVWGEYLAARGFVVATAPLVGTNSPLVRIDAQDLETQVADLELVIARARKLPFVSQRELGVLGFDMGGMAGVLMTMRHRDVDAFVSLDSGILFPHPTGLPRISPGYDPGSLRVPWLHATGRPASPASGEKSLFETATYAERYLLVVEGMEHVYFTSDGAIDGRSAMPNYWGPPSPAGTEGLRAVRQYVFNFFSAFLSSNADSQTFLSRAPVQAETGPKMTLEHRPASRPSITYEELVAAVVAGRGNEAVGRLRAVAPTEPSHPLLQEEYLQRLTVSLMFTWGLGKEAIPVIEFMNERYPSRAGQGLLAEANILAGNYAAATDIYSRYLEQYPNDPIARPRLEWLRGKK